MNLTFILCRKEALAPILDEFGDWEQEGLLRILQSGTTHLSQDGFFLVEWIKPVPEIFHPKMVEEADFLDYASLKVSIPQQASGDEA